MRNFNNPYFSRDIAEFWRRWHISLTTWFRDYVYIPLGGSRPNVVEGGMLNVESKKKFIIARNTFIIFLVSGIWHGANWTFLAWGAYHAVLFLPLILMGKNRKYTGQVAEGRRLPTWKEALQMLLTFGLVVIGWIVFRAETIGQAWEILKRMCDITLFSMPWLKAHDFYPPLFGALVLMILVEWMNRNQQHGLSRLTKYRWVNWLVYYVTIYLIYKYQPMEGVQFIYFQF